jgi:histidine triad (HIT) family protein
LIALIRPARIARRFLLLLARSPLGPFLAGWLFNNMSFALPVKRLRETEHLIAFEHPQPMYPVHILLVPRRTIASLVELEARDAPFLLDLFLTVKDLVDALGLEPSGYRLIANGGRYQEFPYLHFHLVSGVEA